MRAIVIRAARDLRIKDSSDKTPGPGEMCLRLATGGVCGSALLQLRQIWHRAAKRADDPWPRSLGQG